MKDYGIYCIKCLKNGKCYIGQSINVKTRLSGHKAMLRNGNHSNKTLQKDFNLFGELNFEFFNVADCENMDFGILPKFSGHFAVNPMNKLESDFIKKYDSYYNGYNGNIQITFEDDGKGLKLQKDTDDCFEKKEDGTYHLIEGAKCDYSPEHCKSHFELKCDKCGYIIRKREYNYCPICGFHVENIYKAIKGGFGNGNGY